MPTAPEFQAGVIARFNELLRRELQKRGDEEVTSRDLRDAVIDDCLKIAEPYYRYLVEAKVDQQAGWILQRLRPQKVEAVPLLIPGLDLPYRIPVPVAGKATDETSQRWIVLHKATVGDLRKHHVAVDHDLSVRTKYSDHIKLLLTTAVSLCAGDESQIVGDLFAKTSVAPVQP